MRKGLTELVFILDRSGSMQGLESDTIGGFNAMIEKQRKLDGEYSCAVKPPIRQTGNRLSGLTETANASLLA